MSLVSFDIDGTLMKFGRVVMQHPKAFMDAFSQLFGDRHAERFIDSKCAGWTDDQIVKHLMKHTDVPQSEENLARFREKVSQLFIERTNESIEILPGVKNILDYLRRKNVACVIATGNYQPIAWHKLKLAGLDEYFKVGGFGIHDRRADVIKEAQSNAEKFYNTKFTKLFHIGDTVHDVTAALEVGFVPIGVLTGGSKTLPSDCAVFNNLEDGFSRIIKIIDS